MHETPLAPVGRPGRRVGRRVEVHAEIGSTNDRARELLEAGEDGVAVVAELQTAGRGRRGRRWTSPPGRNLMLSVGLRLEIPARHAAWLGMATALAVHDALREAVPVGLKWPNDIVDADGRKLGGLLVDSIVEGGRVTAGVLGIGLNVNWAVDEMPDELRATATSVLALRGGAVDRGALLERLLEQLEAEVSAIEAGRSPLGRYRAACSTIGSDVVVEAGDRRVAGRVVAIDEEGALVLETPSGPETLAAGDVLRVRPAVPA